MAARPPYRSLEERLLANSCEDPERPGCRLWLGAVNNQGYPRLAVREPGRRSPRQVYAHRLAWELHHERSLPDGMSVDHLCLNRRCVAGPHLEAVTPGENTRRRWERAGDEDPDDAGREPGEDDDRDDERD